MLAGPGRSSPAATTVPPLCAWHAAPFTWYQGAVAVLLSENNIKSELSYAYLHAVAARAGLGCHATDRHTDGAGVDAVLRARERFDPSSIYTDFTVDVQLKATSAAPSLQGGRLSFWLKRDAYDKLRTTAAAAPRLLVVLFLPEDPEEWLVLSEEALVAKRCAYWVSLYGAPDGAETGSTVYLARENVLDVACLRRLMTLFSLDERLSCAP